MRKLSVPFQRPALAAAALLAALGLSPPAAARVTRIVIDKVTPLSGQTLAYEQVAGRLFGELDPFDSHNSIIQDIELAPRNAHGKVEYMSTFLLVKPVDMSLSSHLMWQDVPNRGGRIVLAAASRQEGDIGLSSGWQGDNSGDTARVPNDLDVTAHPNITNDYAVCPVAKHRNGKSITGVVMGRILNGGGFDSSGPVGCSAFHPVTHWCLDSSQIIEHSNPLAYQPISLDTRDSRLESRDHETTTGIVTGRHVFHHGEWAWAHCDATHPFPGTPTGSEICMRDGFAPAKVHQVVFTSKDPPLLAVGTAAFRDAAAFFKYETHDDFGNPSPVANGVRWVITRGSSQSGTFIRQLIHFGFTQDEARRKVYDGAWPIIAARRIGLNFRFAKPDLVMKLYEAGSEGPLWWERWPDHVRGLPTRGILDRCRANNSCPKIVEHFGAAEAWGQKLTTGWVGTDAEHDIPLPDNVRRYYFAGSPHGGGNGGFLTAAAPGGIPNCSGTNYGPGTFPTNPMPQTQTVNAIRTSFRQWVMNDVRPLDSVYPKLNTDDDDEDDHHHGRHHRHGPWCDFGRGHRPHHHGRPDLVEPDKRSMGFPEIPAVHASANPDAPNDFIMSMLQYDWGDDLNYTENTGFHDFEPPIVRRVIDQVVPRTDADGNEIGGVPVVLRDAPLGTYLGWNVTATGFNKGKVCNYQGGWIPFALTKADRLSAGDPRPSLEERYVTHCNYVKLVCASADRIMAQGYLLQADRDALITGADASSVLRVPGQASCLVAGAPHPTCQ
ncbi:MAG TPA: alpha/beta hydrolase domain-containing protein [Myxococcales bacterium]|nr:alpha/beta hydrolase domain-containing protein [Myxococcales bacterium]